MTLDEATAQLCARMQAKLDRLVNQAQPGLIDWLAVHEDDLTALCDLVEAGAVLASFTGHNPYCQLEADRIACSQSATSCPGDEAHGPCDCGYEAYQCAVAALPDPEGE